MENNEIKKEELVKATESEFTTYLISEKIDEVASKKWKKLQWFFYAILAILGFFGYDLWNKIKEMREIKRQFQDELSSIRRERDFLNQQLDSKTASLKQQLDSQDSKLSLQTGAFLLQDRKFSLQEKNFEQNANFSNLYYDIFSDQLQQTKTLRDDIKNSSAIFNKYTDSINKKIFEYRTQFNELSSLRDSLKSRVEIIERKTDQNSINGSLKYIYAERSDRIKETFTNPFKPSMYFLPGKPVTLTFVFYNAIKKGRTGKIVQIDVYRNLVKLERSPIEIEEKNGDLIPHIIPIQIGKDIYNIEPVFIYLPPNIGGVLLIPDFVVLKITLQTN